MTECEIWIVIDPNGDYAVGVDVDAAHEAYENDIANCKVLQTYKLKLSVPTPAPRTLTATIPAEADGPLALTLS